MFKLMVLGPFSVCLVVYSALALAHEDAGADPLAQLTGLLTGHYRSEAALTGAEGLWLSDYRVRVQNSALGEFVLYWQIDTGPEQDAYRQRLLVMEIDQDSGLVRQRTWSLREPERFLGQFDRPQLFSDLTADDLFSELPEDCDPLWQPISNGWRGYTDPERCRIFSERHQDWRFIEAEVEVTEEGLRSTERGFDGAGNQLFGTEPGVFIHLRRVER